MPDRNPLSHRVTKNKHNLNFPSEAGIPVTLPRPTRRAEPYLDFSEESLPLPLSRLSETDKMLVKRTGATVATVLLLMGPSSPASALVVKQKEKAGEQAANKKVNVKKQRAQKVKGKKKVEEFETAAKKSTKSKTEKKEGQEGKYYGEPGSCDPGGSCGPDPRVAYPRREMGMGDPGSCDTGGSCGPSVEDALMEGRNPLYGPKAKGEKNKEEKSSSSSFLVEEEAVNKKVSAKKEQAEKVEGKKKIEEFESSKSKTKTSENNNKKEGKQESKYAGEPGSCDPGGACGPDPRVAYPRRAMGQGDPGSCDTGGSCGPSVEDALMEGRNPLYGPKGGEKKPEEKSSSSSFLVEGQEVGSGKMESEQQKHEQEQAQTEGEEAADGNGDVDAENGESFGKTGLVA